VGRLQRASAVLVALAAGALAEPGCKEPTPPPPPPTPEAHPPPAPKHVVERRAGAAVRTMAGSVHVYVPPELRVVDGRWDLLIHFHGGPQNQESSVTRANLAAVVASVNLGVGSDPYGGAFRAKGSWEKLLAEVEQAVATSGRAPNGRLGRVALSAWSAGFASVKGVIDDEERRRAIDAVVVADGLFTSWADREKKTPNMKPLDSLLTYAQAALRGEKLLGLTHARVPTFTYPTVEETTTELLSILRVTRAPPSVTMGPQKGMIPTYEVHQSGFHVWGYEGDKQGDHIAQIRVMGDLLYPLVEKRWARD
jgi:hypothetical protein